MKKLSLLMLLMLTVSSSVHNTHARVPMAGAAELLLFCTFPPYTIFVLGCALEDGIKEASNGIKNLHPHTKLALGTTTLAGIAGGLMHPEDPATGVFVGTAVIGVLSAVARFAEICHDDYYHIDNQILRAISARDTAQVKQLFLEKGATMQDYSANSFAYDPFYNAAYNINDTVIQAEMRAIINAAKSEYDLARYKSQQLKRAQWPQEIIEGINNATTIAEIDALIAAYITAQRLALYKAQAVQKYSESPYSWPREVIEKIEQATTVKELDYIINNWWQ